VAAEADVGAGVAEVTGAACDASVPPAGEVAAVVTGGALVGAVVAAGAAWDATGGVTVADITFVLMFGAPAELGVDPVTVAVDGGAVVLTGAAETAI
jgi:hypothetical protein